MSVSSAKQAAKKTKKSSTSRKRRQNENVELDELASLVPWSGPPTTVPSNSLVATSSGSGNKPPTMAVLRLTLNFLKLHDFVKDASSANVSSDSEVTSWSGNHFGRMEEAIDGFLLILDKDANILYVSETIAGYVGLIQQDVIGQNLSDITDPQFSSDIADNLKPSLLFPSSEVDDLVVTQYRQFHVKFKPSVSYSTQPSHCITQVCGNLKVKLSTVNNNGIKSVQPSVVGFVGECRVYNTFSSIPELSPPRSSFIVIKSTDMRRILSIEAAVKDVIGYDPSVLFRRDHSIHDFFHPADVRKVVASRERVLQTGHGVGPRVRFLAGTGEWIWIQAEVHLRYKGRTNTPQYWEIKIRSLSQLGSNLTLFERRELCPPTSTTSHALPMLPHTYSHSKPDSCMFSSRSSKQDTEVKSESLPKSCGLLSHTSSRINESSVKAGFAFSGDSARSEIQTKPSSVSAPQLQSVMNRLPITGDISKLLESENASKLPRLSTEQSTDFDDASLSGDVSPLGSTMSFRSGLQQLSPHSHSSVSSPSTPLVAQLESCPVTSGNSDLSWPGAIWSDPQNQQQFLQSGVSLAQPSQIQTECLASSGLVSDSPVHMDFNPDQFLNFTNSIVSSDGFDTELYSSNDIANGFRSNVCIPVEAQESPYQDTSSVVDSIFTPSSAQSPVSLRSLSPSNDFNPQIPSSFDFSSSVPSSSPAPPGLVPRLDDTDLPTSQLLHAQNSSPWIDFSDPVMECLFGDSMTDNVLSSGTAVYQDPKSDPSAILSSSPQVNFVQNALSSQNTQAHLQSQSRSDFVSRLQNTIYSCSSSNILQQFM